MRNYLILNGTDSRDFGVYISGQGTFSAPEKAYEFYNIPGRNGAILGSEKRLENIEVSYECFIYANFSQNIADFRTFLLSLNGYQKLTDSYHPDEYRYAAYVGPFEPSVTSKNDAGSFTLTFNCKPQRYLVSGDTAYTIDSNGNQSAKGTKIHLYTGQINETAIRWGGRIHSTRWVNKEPIVTPANPYVLEYITDIAIYVDGVMVYHTSNPFMLGDRVTDGYVNILANNGFFTAGIRSLPTTGWSLESGSLFKVSTSFLDLYACTHYPVATSVAELSTVDYGVYLGSSYIYLKDKRFTSVSNLETWLASAGVEIDVKLSGINGFTKIYPTPSINYPYPDFVIESALADNLDYSYLSIPLNGDGSVWINPSEFPSNPMLRAYGTGSFTVNDVTVTVADCDSYVDIDCELMDCYEGSTNRNGDVSFSTYDFPKLKSGNNDISIVSGITEVEITPRWWRV